MLRKNYKILWSYIDTKPVALKWLKIVYPFTIFLMIISIIGLIPKFPIFVYIFIIALMFFSLINSSYLRLTASEIGITIKYGLMGLFKYFIPRDSLLAVRRIPYTASYYFDLRKGPIFPTNGGWTGILGSFDGEALAIVSKDKKYIVSCPNAIQSEEILNDIYNLDPLYIFEFPYKHRKD